MQYMYQWKAETLSFPPVPGTWYAGWYLLFYNAYSDCDRANARASLIHNAVRNSVENTNAIDCSYSSIQKDEWERIDTLLHVVDTVMRDSTNVLPVLELLFSFNFATHSNWSEFAYFSPYRFSALWPEIVGSSYHLHMLILDGIVVEWVVNNAHHIVGVVVARYSLNF